MFKASLIFFMLALFGFFLGKVGFLGFSEYAGRVFLTIFLILAVVSFIGSMISEKPKKLI